MTKNLLKVLVRIFIPSVLVAINLAVAFGLIQPVQKTLSHVRQESTNINEKSLQLIDHQTALSQYKNDQKHLNELVNRAQALVPEKSQVADFVLQLETMVKSIGLTPSTLNVSEQKINQAPQPVDLDSETPAKPTTKITQNLQPAAVFSVAFNGNFADLLNMLEQLKVVDRFNTVEKLSVAYGDQSQSLTATIEGKIYFAPIGQFSQKIDEPAVLLDKLADDLLKRQHFGQPLAIPSPLPSGSSDPFGKLSSP